MDFILDNIYWLVIAAAGIVQWWKSTQEAKAEARRDPEGHGPDEIEEMIAQAERMHSRPAVPPPIPQGAPAPVQAPTLHRSAPAAPNPYQPNSGELARQTKLVEQMQLLKLAKKQSSLDESPIITSRRKKPLESTGSLRGRLQNRRELRQAFVLKEILEKPVGLR